MHVVVKRKRRWARIGLASLLVLSCCLYANPSYASGAPGAVLFGQHALIPSDDTTVGEFVSSFLPEYYQRMSANVRADADATPLADASPANLGGGGAGGMSSFSLVIAPPLQEGEGALLAYTLRFGSGSAPFGLVVVMDGQTGEVVLRDECHFKGFENYVSMRSVSVDPTRAYVAVALIPVEGSSGALFPICQARSAAL